MGTDTGMGEDADVLVCLDAFCLKADANGNGHITSYPFLYIEKKLGNLSDGDLVS